MTTPSPVFQRLKPLITVNGLKNRSTEDRLPIIIGSTGSSSTHAINHRTSLSPAHPTTAHDHPPLDLEDRGDDGLGIDPQASGLKQSSSILRHAGIGAHSSSPDDRWWQFTLPTKYRRKVEEYLSRGGQGIGGVHPFDQQQLDHHQHRRPDHPSTSPLTPFPPMMEVPEIDEDRRKVLALLKRSPFPTTTTNTHPDRYSSLGSTHEFNEFQQPYDGSLTRLPPNFYRNSLLKEQTEALNGTYHHPPTDFPLSAFSRKLSLTPSQQLLNQPRLPNVEGDENHPVHFDDHRLSKAYLTSTSNQTANGLTHHHQYQSRQHQTRLGSIVSYFMHHPTAPLVCRLLNFILTVISLGICASIRQVELKQHVTGVLGSSTVFILVVAPLGLIHNLFAIYCEYFGAPIGIWSVSWKMFHTLSELVFVSLWSAGLALSFDDHLKSSLGCAKVTTTTTSTQRTSNLSTQEILSQLRSISHPSATESSLINQLIANLSPAQSQLETELQLVSRLRQNEIHHLCELQASLVSIIFIGLALYTVVLVVSLFRIFIKVSRKY